MDELGHRWMKLLLTDLLDTPLITIAWSSSHLTQ